MPESNMLGTSLSLLC